MIFNVSVQRVWQNTMLLTQTGQTDFEVISVSCMYLRDASTYGVEAVVYSVVRQEDGSTQTVATAKAISAKRTLTVPSLGLVNAHMATNLVINVKNALKDLPEPTI